MQEPLLPTTLTQKFYNERSVLIGTFLGGPLAGAYLISQNFKALDESSKIGKTWLISIGMLLLAMSTAFIPGVDKLPPIVYSFIFCTTAHWATKKYQGSRIEMHQTEGGKMYSTGRAALIGLAGCALMVGLFYGLVYMASQGV